MYQTLLVNFKGEFKIQFGYHGIICSQRKVVLASQTSMIHRSNTLVHPFNMLASVVLSRNTTFSNKSNKQHFIGAQSNFWWIKLQSPR